MKTTSKKNTYVMYEYATQGHGEIISGSRTKEVFRSKDLAHAKILAIRKSIYLTSYIELGKITCIEDGVHDGDFFICLSTKYTYRKWDDKVDEMHRVYDND